MRPDRIIVVAWVDMSGMGKTGNLIRPDGVNYREEYKAVEAPHALIWALKGSEVDEHNAMIYAAREHADKNRWKVFSYPLKERDPLNAARATISKSESA
jgi:hypothetical protein